MKKLIIYIVVAALITTAIFVIVSKSGDAENNKENTAKQNPIDKKNKNNTTPETNKKKEKIVPVEVLVMKKNNIKATVPFTAKLEPIHEVDIVAEVSGKITQVNKKLGQQITTTDVLAIIDDEIPLSQYKQAQSQLLSAENNLKIASLNLKSDKTLFENNDISKLAYENSVLAVKTAEANKLMAAANLSLMKKNYNNTKIKSSFNGIISRKNIELGQMVNLGSPLYRVVDIQTLKVEIGISQDIINHIKVGALAQIYISALNNLTVEGVLKYISPQADEATGLFKAEIHLPNTKNFKIRAGMTAKIDLSITNGGEELTIPNYALVHKTGGNYIYKVKNNRAELIEINLGETVGQFTIIDSGLFEKDSIVVVGMKNLGEKTPIFVETVR